MKIESNIKWHCQKGGGLFLGIRVEFPTDYYDLKWHSRGTCIHFGFLFFTLSATIKYNFIKGLPQ